MNRQQRIENDIKKLEYQIIGNIIQLLIFGFLLSISIVCMVQRFKCPEMTEMEIFLSIKETIFLTFQNC